MIDQTDRLNCGRKLRYGISLFLGNAATGGAFGAACHFVLVTFFAVASGDGAEHSFG